MIQPQAYNKMFIGAIYAKGNKEYSLSTLSTNFPGATLFTLKTKKKQSEAVMITILGGTKDNTVQSVSYQIDYNESISWDGVTQLRIMFNQDVVVAIAKEVEV